LCHLPFAQACRQIHTIVVVRKLKAAGLMAFSGTLHPTMEPLGAPVLGAPRLPLPSFPRLPSPSFLRRGRPGTNSR